MPYITGETAAPPSILPPLLTETAPDVDNPVLDGLPEYELQSTFVQRYLLALANELQRIEQVRQELIENFFPATADALLVFFEQMLMLPVNPPGVTLAVRQQTVLSFMQSLKTQGTGLEWEAVMNSLLGSSWTYEEHDPANPSSPPPYRVLIRIPYSPSVGAPVGLTGTPVTGTGALAGDEYFYAVTARTPWGETVPSTPLSVTLSATGEVELSWTATGSPTVGYSIYRGAEPVVLYALGTSSIASFTDNGSVAPTSSLAPMTDTSAAPTTGTALALARAITPAHIEIDIGFTGGFIVGISDVGDAL
jgi:hypothetical protein